MNEGQEGLGQQHPSHQQWKGVFAALIILDGAANSLMMMMAFITGQQMEKKTKFVRSQCGACLI